MNNNQLNAESCTQNAKKKRIRLYPKQRRLLRQIFDDGRTLRQALADLRIRPQTFDRWLTQPLFAAAYEKHIARLQQEVRIETALRAPQAVRSLGSLSETADKQETSRKAAGDLLKLNQSFQSGGSNPKNGTSPGKGDAQGDTSGLHTGSASQPIRRPFESLRAQFRRPGDPPNHHFQPPNRERLRFPHLSRSRPPYDPDEPDEIDEPDEPETQ